MANDLIVERLKDDAFVIDVYPVGLLSDLAFFVHAVDRTDARRKLRYVTKCQIERIQRHEWRALKSYFNGYLAEHATLGTRAGHGWTRGRALRDLARHLVEEEQNKEIAELIGIIPGSAP